MYTKLHMTHIYGVKPLPFIAHWHENGLFLLLFLLVSLAQCSVEFWTYSGIWLVLGLYVKPKTPFKLGLGCKCTKIQTSNTTKFHMDA